MSVSILITVISEGLSIDSITRHGLFFIVILHGILLHMRWGLQRRQVHKKCIIVTLKRIDTHAQLWLKLTYRDYENDYENEDSCLSHYEQYITKTIVCHC